LTGADRWFHDLARKHGMPDGFYCPQGDMIVAFWSPKPVRLDASARGILNFAASIAAQQLRPHMVLPRKKPRALSPSETKALLYYSLGESPAEIARRLSSTGKRPISTKTVHSFLDRAREKLKAKSRAHAVRIAIHGRLITYALFVVSGLL
jgi:DNA-binding CsgD family transcriptional regulator